MNYQFQIKILIKPISKLEKYFSKFKHRTQITSIHNLTNYQFYTQSYKQDNQIILRPMSSLWNILSISRTGVVRLAASGNEMFGTVIQHGINNKTVTVRVSARHWNKKYRRFLYGHSNKQVHDQLNYCVTGDKVVIKSCLKLSKLKAYFVKSIVRPMGRDEGEKELHPTFQKFQFDIKDNPIPQFVDEEQLFPINQNKGSKKKGKKQKSKNKQNQVETKAQNRLHENVNKQNKVIQAEYVSPTHFESDLN